MDLSIILSSDKIDEEKKLSIVTKIQKEKIYSEDYESVKKFLKDKISDDAELIVKFIKKQQIEGIISKIGILSIAEIKTNIFSIDNKYKLNGGRGSFTVDNNDVICEFLEDLKSSDIISSYSNIENRVKINRKIRVKRMKNLMYK
ncbi:MAG: hypothetical protein ACRC6T_08305 [Sarcina sp.]